MAQIRIRVGAIADASLKDVFRPLEDSAKRARKVVNQEVAAGATESARKQKTEAERMGETMLSVYRTNAKRYEDTEVQKTTVTAREARRREKIVADAAMAEMRYNEKIASEKDRAAAKRSATLRKYGSTVARAGATALSFGARAAGSVGRGAGIDFDLGAYATQNVEFGKRAMDLTNSGYMKGAAGANGMRQNPAEVMKQIQSVANDTAYSFNDAAAGLQAFVGKTGDLATGRDILKDMAVLSKASGSNLEDMVDAAGDVSNQLGDVPNKGQVISNIMRAIAGQGKLGAVEIKDLATQMAKVASAAGQIQGDAGQNIALLGAFAQEARQRGGAASASQAATSVQGMINTFKTPARIAAFRAQGVDVIDKQSGMIRNPEEIVVQALQKKGMDPEGFKKMFANVQGARAVEGFATIYRQAYAGSQGKNDTEKMADATKAVRAEFERLKGAVMSQEEVTDSFSNAMKTDASKAQVLNNKLSQLAEKVSGPILTSFEILEHAIDGLAKSPIGELAENVIKANGYFLKMLTGSADEEEATRKAQEDKITRTSLERADEFINRATGEGAEGGSATITGGQLRLGKETLRDLQDESNETTKRVNDTKAFMDRYSHEAGGSAADDEAMLKGQDQDKYNQYMKDKESLKRLADAQTKLHTVLDNIANKTLKVEVVNPPHPKISADGTTPGVKKPG